MTNNKYSLLRKITVSVACFLCLAAPAYYSHLLITNAVNAPYWDDYDSLLSFTNLFVEADSWAKRFGLIISQHNEHRVVFLRLVAVSVFHLNGHLDFKLLCYIGNAALVLAALFLFLSFKSGGRFKVLYFFPALFLLFQPQYYDSLLWPTAQLSHFYVILFALVTIFLIGKRSRFSFLAACIFAVLTIFTQGNGILIVPVGLAALTLKKRYKQAAIWSLISAAALSAYFIGYGQLPGNPSLTEALLNLKKTIPYIFFFTGSAAGFSSFYLSLFWGTAIALYFIFLTLRKYYKVNSTLYFFYLFILLTISLSALFRSERGIEFLLSQPRYKFVAIFTVILAYLSLCEIIQKKQYGIAAAVIGLLAAIAFFIASFRLYSPKVVGISETLKAGLVRWQVDGRGLYYPHQAKATKILSESINKSIYRYPEDLLQEFSSTPYVFPKKNISKSLKSFIDTVAENDEYIYVDGWAFLSAQNMAGQKTSVVLRSSEQAFAFPTVSLRRPDIAALFRSKGLEDSGFGALIRKKMILPGRYEVGVYVESRDGRGLSFTGKYIEIKK